MGAPGVASCWGVLGGTLPGGGTAEGAEVGAVWFAMFVPSAVTEEEETFLDNEEGTELCHCSPAAGSGSTIGGSTYIQS